MFRRSNSGEFFFLRRETNSKENADYINKIFMNIEIATNFKAVKLG